MKITRGQLTATVAVNLPLCREHFRLVLRAENFPATEPGQFVQVACRDLDRQAIDAVELDWTPGDRITSSLDLELTAPLAVLRRPFSLAGRRDIGGAVELDIIHRVVGVGTGWMSQLSAGDSVHILGPLGNTFTLPQQNEIALLIGGGVGIPPMIYLAEKLAGRAAVAFAGALTRDLLPLTILGDIGDIGGATGAEPRLNIDQFARHQIPTIITTDDGTYGYRGFVTQALEEYLDAHRAGPTPVLYTCGPEPMMKRIADIAERRGLQCQIAVERAMACGMGTCQSCCIRVRKPDPNQPPLVGKDWGYRLACTDGPVFRGSDLLW